MPQLMSGAAAAAARRRYSRRSVVLSDTQSSGSAWESSADDDDDEGTPLSLRLTQTSVTSVPGSPPRRRRGSAVDSDDSDFGFS